MKKFLITIILTSTMFQAQQRLVSASTGGFFDDFESGLTNWTMVHSQSYDDPKKPCQNGTQPATWTTENGQATIEIYGASCSTELIPNDLNLDGKSYLYEFDWTFQSTTDMDRNALFAWQDSKNWYGIKVYGSQVRIQKVIQGQHYSIPNSTANYSFQAGHSYHFSLYVTQRGQIGVLIDSEPVISLQDRPDSIVGFRTIGLQASVGANSHSVTHFDNVRVTIQDPFLHELPVTYFRQDDPLWLNQEYDSAREWSDQLTIQHWGCALTSMVMILQYYDISKLPDGQLLTPASLNEWLKYQPDGYVGNGALNWLAVTRLTRLMNAQHGTPKLEYRRFDNLPLIKAQEELTKEHPVILHMNGHFLVGSGLAEAADELIIKDPLFWYSWLSQHQTNLLSTRVFTPSLTDLSYILVATDPEVKVTITDQAGEPMSEVGQYTEQIIDHFENRGQSSPKTQFVELAKPVSGRYLISLKATDQAMHDAYIFAYDEEGNQAGIQKTIPASGTSLTVGLNFDSTATSTFDTNSPFIILQKTMSALKDQNGFSTPMLYSLMEYLTRVGEKAPAAYHAQIISVLQTQVTGYPTLFSQFARDVLLEQLGILQLQFPPAP